MFLGHFALGLAAKRAAPRLSLGVLFGAAQLADLLWPFLLAVGLEQVRIEPGNTVFTPLDFVSYPYSHSLLLLIVWGVAAGWLFARRERGLVARMQGGDPDRYRDVDRSGRPMRLDESKRPEKPWHPNCGYRRSAFSRPLAIPCARSSA